MEPPKQRDPCEYKYASRYERADDPQVEGLVLRFRGHAKGVKYHHKNKNIVDAE